MLIPVRTISWGLLMASMIRPGYDIETSARHQVWLVRSVVAENSYIEYSSYVEYAYIEY